VPRRIIGSWYTGRRWVGCYIWYSEEGPGRAAAPPSPLLAVPNVTAHLSTASVPITVLLCNGPLLCGFNMAIKGLSEAVDRRATWIVLSNIVDKSFLSTIFGIVFNRRSLTVPQRTVLSTGSLK